MLVAGLGNERITPDAVGPKSVKMLTVTRHVKRLDPGLYSRLGFGECAAIIPGVLGDTGIESADIIRGAAEAVRPRCIIAPKDCDMITECLANVASKAINIFVHGVQGAL